MSDWMSRGRANAMAQDEALRRKWQGLASQAGNKVQIQTPKISPAKPAGEAKPAARPMPVVDLIASLPDLPYSGLSQEKKSQMDDYLAKTMAQKELSYINSREYAHKRDRQIANTKKQLDTAEEAMNKAYLDGVGKPIPFGSNAPQTNPYETAKANFEQWKTKYNTLTDEGNQFMQRNELEILSKGGNLLMEKVSKLSEQKLAAETMDKISNVKDNSYSKAFEQSYAGMKAQYGDKLESWLEYAERSRNLERTTNTLTKSTQFGRDKNDFVTWNTSVAAGLGKPLGALDIAGQHNRQGLSH